MIPETQAAILRRTIAINAAHHAALLAGLTITQQAIDRDQAALAKLLIREPGGSDPWTDYLNGVCN